MEEYEVYITPFKRGNLYYLLDHFASLKGRPPLPTASGVSGKGNDISLYESIID